MDASCALPLIVFLALLGLVLWAALMYSIASAQRDHPARTSTISALRPGRPWTWPHESTLHSCTNKFRR